MSDIIATSDALEQDAMEGVDEKEWVSDEYAQYCKRDHPYMTSAKTLVLELEPLPSGPLLQLIYSTQQSCEVLLHFVMDFTVQSQLISDLT